MHASRTTLSFLDLALMLLSAFAYMHFVNIADAETRSKIVAVFDPALKPLGSYQYKAADFFGQSNAMLSEFALKEIAEILTVQQKQQLVIFVPPVSQSANGQRLRQWEKVAARSAAIADAFEKAGQDGKMITLKMPKKLVSQPNEGQNILLTFLPIKTAISGK